MQKLCLWKFKIRERLPWVETLYPPHTFSLPPMDFVDIFSDTKVEITNLPYVTVAVHKPLLAVSMFEGGFSQGVAKIETKIIEIQEFALEEFSTPEIPRTEVIKYMKAKMGSHFSNKKLKTVYVRGANFSVQDVFFLYWPFKDVLKYYLIFRLLKRRKPKFQEWISKFSGALYKRWRVLLQAGFWEDTDLEGS